MSMFKKNAISNTLITHIRNLSFGRITFRLVFPLILAAAPWSAAEAGTHAAGNSPANGAVVWTTSNTTGCVDCHHSATNTTGTPPDNSVFGNAFAAGYYLISSGSTTPFSAFCSGSAVTPCTNQTLAYYASNPANITTAMGMVGSTTIYASASGDMAASKTTAATLNQEDLSAYFASLLTPVLAVPTGGTYASAATYNGSINGLSGQDYLVSDTTYSATLGTIVGGAYGTTVVTFTVTNQGSSATFTGTLPTVTAATTYRIKLTAKNSGNATAGTTTYDITVNPPLPSVTNPGSLSGQVAVAFSYSIAATNSATSYTATPLPAGLSVNASTGVISGTPTTAGVTSTTISATNVTGPTSVGPFNFTISPVTPIINSAATATGQNGTVGFSYSITSSNVTPTSYSVTGTLPTGVSLNTATGVISGTPTQTGTFNVTVNATLTQNTVSSTGSKALTITINPPTPVISSGSSVNAQIGTNYPTLYQITASNTPTSYSITAGTLPSGLSLNTATGVISGTPASGATTTTVTIGAQNAGGIGTQSLTLNLSPEVTAGQTVTGVSGTALTSYQITASNVPTSFTLVSGTLPSGLSMNSTGLITGTPTAVVNGGTITVNASNAVGTSANQTITFNITLGKPVITSSSAASGTGGQAFANYQITATNAPLTSYGLTGTLPTGLTFTSATGVISGTPTQIGSFPVTITATNATGTSAGQTLTITISAVAPVITSANTASGTGGQAFSYQIAANNLPSSYSVTGTLPTGVTLNTSTGLISGTPTQTGTFNVTLGATNSSGTGSQTLAITINLVAPVVTSAATAAGASNTAFTPYQITASNLPASYSATGLPTGLSLNTATGVISGTPTTVGTSVVTVSATNAAGTGNLAVTFSITLGVPAVTSANTATAIGGQAFNYQITSTNSPTSYSLTGTLPTGLSLNTASGAISGTPTQTGAFSVTLKATNASGTGSLTLSLTVNAATPTMSATASIGGSGGQAFSYQVIAANLPTNYSATGLPAGLGINTSTGLISGTPSVNGVFSVTVTASNSAGSVNQTLTITLSAALPAITSPNIATGSGGSAFNYQIIAGNIPTSFGALGLPAGLSVNTSTGAISGTPTVNGVFNATITATNAAGTASQSLTVTLSASLPVVTSAATATGSGGNAFTYQITANNVPTSFNATGLPAGLSVNTSTGAITGTPTVNGTFNVTVSATNAAGTGNLAVTITLTVSAPVITSANTVNGILSTVFNYQITASSLPTGYALAGALPAGLTFTATTGSISGTPTASGTSTVTVSASNAAGSASASLAITISDIPAEAGAASTTTQINKPVTVDLAPFIKGTGITGVKVTTAPVHGAVMVSGTNVTYTPHQDYFGTDSFSYVAYGKVGVSANSASVSITIVGRPDPLKDARVTGMVNAEAATIKRFGTAQLFNFQQRLESRHHAVYGATSMNSTSMPGGTPVPAGGATPSGQGRGYFNSWQPGTVLSYENDPNTLLHSAQLSSNAQPGASDPLYGVLMNAMAGVLTNYALNLGAVSNAVNVADNDEFGRLEVWLAGNLRFGTRSQSGFESKFSTDGISAGADKRIDRKLTLGMGMGYARDKSDIGSDGTNSSASGTSVAGYASYMMDSGNFIDALLGYGKVTFNTNRFVPTVSEFARSSRRGDQLFGSLSFGYEYRQEGLLWSPYGRFDFSLNRLAEGTESGAGSNALAYASQNLRSSHLSFGMRAQSVHQTDFGVVQPRARFEYQRGFESNGQTSVAYADMLDTQYIVAGTSQNTNAVVLGLGNDFVLSDTLRLAFDYQRLRSGGFENYQSINLRLTKTIKGKNDLASLLEDGYGSSVKRTTGLTVIGSLAHDDNVSRASEKADKRSDTIYGLTVNKMFSFLPTKFTRLTANGFLDVEKFRTYTGLGHVSAGAQGEFAYRFSGDFGSPAIGIFARYTSDAYESDLRDGARRSIGVNLRKALTDRISLFMAAADNVRTGKSDVFNTRDKSGRMNLDYALTAGQTLYLTGEYRKGDIVSSGQPSLKILDSSIVFVRDDVFISPAFYDYRMKGRTGLFTLGYNYALGVKDSLDFSWRHVKSTPDVTPPYAAPVQYLDNQLTASYLMAF